MVVSLAIHGILLLVAVSFVAVKVIVKENQDFKAPIVKRPKMPLKKIQVPVKMKKQKPKPRLRQRIVSKPQKFAAIKMPAIAGVKGGLGNMGGDGFNLGFDLDIGDLFGGNKYMGNELIGTFYDLKQTKDGKPIEMDNAKYIAALNKFAKGGWRQGYLNDYFKAPKEKYASFFMFPHMPADAAPEAYGVENIVQPKHWVVYYEGQISAPETGRYRFCGISDDVMLVRVRSRLVIDASYPVWQGKVSTWKSDDDNNRKFPMVNQHMVIGDWFSLTKGKPADIEVLVGECPGGVFYAQLLIEQKGKEYKQVPFSYKKGEEQVSGTRPVLPVFKTKAIPEKLIGQMEINPNEATLDGNAFGLVK